jgi:hypothetical protein
VGVGVSPRFRNSLMNKVSGLLSPDSLLSPPTRHLVTNFTLPTLDSLQRRPTPPARLCARTVLRPSPELQLTGDKLHVLSWLAALKGDEE